MFTSLRKLAPRSVTRRLLQAGLLFVVLAGTAGVLPAQTGLRSGTPQAWILDDEVAFPRPHSRGRSFIPERISPIRKDEGPGSFLGRGVLPRPPASWTPDLDFLPGEQEPFLPLPRLPQMPAQPPAPVETTGNDVQQRISRRYRDQGLHGLLNLPAQTALALYDEVLRLIDERHIEPAALADRVQRGLQNLAEAVRNPEFVRVNRLSANSAQLDAYRQALSQLSSQYPVRTRQDALSLANRAGDLSQRQIGLRPAAAILEFVYGACETLDAYSAFVPPEKVAGASLQMEESVVGIGVQVEVHELGAVVRKVLSGSPAAEAGLRADDVIVAVSGQPLAGFDLEQTVGLIAGPAGSSVLLGIRRGPQATFMLTVPRKNIPIRSVNDVQMMGNGSRIGYLKLDRFAASTSSELDAALWSLHQQGMQGLVIDLRGNPGGLLTAAIEVSDKFLPGGTIVSTRGRTAADNTQELAKHAQTWKVPLVVLIDGGSASASEIFAAAIQENGRGTVVGRTSYGKGTVQTQFPLRSAAGASLRITTARFYSPKGRVMSGIGVEPDVWSDENTNRWGTDPQADADLQAALNVAERQLLAPANGLTQTRPSYRPLGG